MAPADVGADVDADADGGLFGVCLALAAGCDGVASLAFRLRCGFRLVISSPEDELPSESLELSPELLLLLPLLLLLLLLPACLVGGAGIDATAAATCLACVAGLRDVDDG